MAIGRHDQGQQEGLWIPSHEIVRGEGHVFYRALNALFRRHGFDEFVEGLVEEAKVFADGVGRPSIPPGVYFRMALVGYFEGLGSERGVSWRCADSMSLRDFLGYELTRETPDHSTMSRWRRKLPESVHRTMFEWVVRVAREEKILKGRKVAVDATTLEANAAMKSIVRKADGATYQAYLKKLAKAEGIDDPTPQDLQRMDRKRKKKVSNRRWKSRTDSHARIARLKDGRTRMAYKLENAMDIESRITVAAEVHSADKGDTQTIGKTLLAADATTMRAGVEGGITSVIADRGYHSDAVLHELNSTGYRTYIAEPVRGRRNWRRQRRLNEELAAVRQKAFHANRRRGRSATGRALQKKRAEFPERGFAHLKRTGGFARVFVRGRANVTKKAQAYVAAANLSVILRTMLGIGTPRSLQGRVNSLLRALSSLLHVFVRLVSELQRPFREIRTISTPPPDITALPTRLLQASAWAPR